MIAKWQPHTVKVSSVNAELITLKQSTLYIMILIFQTISHWLTKLKINITPMAIFTWTDSFSFYYLILKLSFRKPEGIHSFNKVSAYSLISVLLTAKGGIAEAKRTWVIIQVPSFIYRKTSSVGHLLCILSSAAGVNYGRHPRLLSGSSCDQWCETVGWIRNAPENGIYFVFLKSFKCTDSPGLWCCGCRKVFCSLLFYPWGPGDG